MRHGHEHGPVAGRGVHTTSPGRQHPNPEDFFAHYVVQITVSVPHPVFFGKQAWVRNMAHRSASSRPLQASESSWSHGSIPPPHELPRGDGDLLVVSLSHAGRHQAEQFVTQWHDLGSWAGSDAFRLGPPRPPGARAWH
jgi:hypothetical protein